MDLMRIELDARTLYDVACIREARPDATREDVELKAIALRNWQAVTAFVDAMNGANTRSPPEPGA